MLLLGDVLPERMMLLRSLCRPVVNGFDKLTNSLFDVAASQIDPLILAQQRRHICICQDDRKNYRATFPRDLPM